MGCGFVVFTILFFIQYRSSRAPLVCIHKIEHDGIVRIRKANDTNHRPYQVVEASLIDTVNVCVVSVLF